MNNSEIPDDPYEFPTEPLEYPANPQPYEPGYPDSPEPDPSQIPVPEEGE